MNLWRFSLREILNRPGRAALTLLSVVLGVASVVSVTLATGAARSSYQDLFAAVAGKADLVVSAYAPGGFSEDVVADLDEVPGLAAVVPSLQQPTKMYGESAKGRNIQVVLQAMGVDPQRDKAVRDYVLAAGRYFEREGEAVVDAGFAQNIGLEIGQKIRLGTDHSLKRTEFEIVGFVKLKGAAGIAQAGIIFIPLKQAQRMFRAKGKVDAIHLVFKKDVDRLEVQKAAADVLPTFVFGKADLLVSAKRGSTFDESVVDRLRQVSGLAAVVPSVQRPTTMEGQSSQGKSIRAKELQLMGVDPQFERAVRDYKVAAGRYFEKEGEAVVVADFAKGVGLEVGQKVRLLSSQGWREFEIVGLVELQAAAGAGQAGMIFVPLKSAQSMFAGPGKINVIHLIYDPGVEPADRQTVQQAAAEVAQENLIVSAEARSALTIEPPPSGSQTAEESMLGPETGLFLASTMSMVVAAFIILNTFFINVSERRRQLSILRAIGATRSQILWLLMTEGLLLGVVGTLLGMAAGVVGAFFLTRAMGELFQATLPAVQFAIAPFLLAGGFGIATSLTATYLPARAAGLVSPLEGMGGMVQTDAVREKGNMFWFGVVLLTVGGSLMVLVVTDRVPKGILNVVGFLFALFGAADSVIPEIVISLVGTVMQLIGSVFILRACLRPIVAGVAAVLSPLLSVEGRLGRHQLLRRRTRTSLTIGVLFMAVSTGIGMGSTLLDNVGNVTNWARKAIVGDFFIRVMMPNVITGETADIPDGVREEIEKIPGVKRMGSAKFVPVRVFTPGDEKPQQVVVIAREFTIHDKAFLDLKDTLRFNEEGQPMVDDEGEPVVARPPDPVMARERLLAGDVVISTVLAQRMKLETGDEVIISAPGGPRALRIAGTANDYIISGLVVYMDRGTAETLLGIEGENALMVDAEKSEYASVEAALKEICLEHGILLQSQAELNSTIDGMMSGVIACQWVILVLGFCVSAFGVVNTLTMNVLEQTRELGLLRIVAMTRWQIRKLILGQAAIIGVIGLAPGVVMGLGVAWFINYSTLAVTGHPIDFVVRPTLLAGSFFAGLLIVLLAAWIPAERAARLDLATALQYE